ncbi:MAG: hypothetical protein ACRDBG_24170, partial [Waterburya sp.]
IYLELDQTETEIYYSILEIDSNPVEEFTSQSTQLQGTDQSTKLQTDLDAHDSVDSPNAGLLDNAIPLAGATIAGAGAAVSGLFNREDNQTSTETTEEITEENPNLEASEVEGNALSFDSVDNPEMDLSLDNSAIETDANPVDEFTSQSTQLQGTDQSTDLQTGFNFNDDLDSPDVELADNPTSVEEAGREVSSLFTESDTQSTAETTGEVTEVNPNLEANTIDSVGTPEANSSDSDTNWVDGITQSGAAIAGGAAFSGFLNREENQSSTETTDEVTEVDPNLETTELESNAFSLDSVDTPEMDLTLDDFAIETDANPAEEFTSQSTKLQGTEQSTRLQTDLTDLNFNDDLDNLDLGLTDDLTSVEESERGVSSFFTQQDNQSTVEPQIVESDLDNSGLGITNNNFADNVIADAETVVADDRDSNFEEITFDETTDSENVSLNDITFDENDDSINASLQDITFD